MTRAEAAKYMRRFYRAMKAGPKLRARIHKGMSTAEFKGLKRGKARVFSGLYEPDPAGSYKIHINPDKRRVGTVVSTILHELLHHIENDKGHSWIGPTEKALYGRLSDRQLTNLMKRVFR